MANHNIPQHNTHQKLSPFEKQQLIAQNAHDEYTGRGAAMGYVAFLLLGILVLYFTDWGFPSLIVQTIVNMVLNALDVFLRLFKLTKDNGIILIGVCVVIWFFYQNQMRDRAHQRHNFFGDRNPEH